MSSARGDRLRGRRGARQAGPEPPRRVRPRPARRLIPARARVGPSRAGPGRAPPREAREGFLWVGLGRRSARERERRRHCERLVEPPTPSPPARAPGPRARLAWLGRAVKGWPWAFAGRGFRPGGLGSAGPLIGQHDGRRRGGLRGRASATAQNGQPGRDHCAESTPNDMNLDLLRHPLKFPCGLSRNFKSTRPIRL